MKGEKVFFRKRFFGGFNREDVVKYISKIADERNNAIAEKEMAESNAQALAEELIKLRRERDKLVRTAAVAEEPVAVAEEPVAIVEEPVAVADEPVVAEASDTTVKEHPSVCIKVKMRRK